ncbi:hypothetical protein CG723_32775 [Streptomyces sp. CB01635]|uniref:hypothetical protein n=1 Tax=unclassified Streptomyces TaxID=2593676 RepID=UPI000C271EF5|nr:hypothetical protein [Streptomyces sp. CB01635]PJN07546.1 hypothetical protein CG723_32775 [Streptomyces sp. CB01635]
MPSPFPKLSTSLEQGRPHSRLRLLGLLAVVVLTVLLPLAGASAGPVGDAAAEDSLNSGELPTGNADSADKVDDKPGASESDMADTAATDAAGKARRSHGRPPGTSVLAGLGIATTARCGPELASPDGIEAQTCVLTQGRDTWARTYYRNATGGPLSSVLTLMAPAGRTVQMYCVVGAQDEPGTCDTPRERTSGEASAYSAVAEFAGAGDAGPLLLRSGSNAPTPPGR